MLAIHPDRFAGEQSLANTIRWWLDILDKPETSDSMRRVGWEAITRLAGEALKPS